jgi:glutaredoxin 3
MKIERRNRTALWRIVERMIDTNIVLYQAEWCPYCARVRQLLTDLLLDYKIVNVPIDHAERGTLQEIFGTTGIPSMIDGEVKIADDDDAIIAYLRKTYAEPAARGA